LTVLSASNPRFTDKKTRGQKDEEIIIAERERGQEFQARMRAGKERKKSVAASAGNNPIPAPPTSWKDITSGASSHGMTTDNLETLRKSTNGSLGRMITVNIMAMIGGRIAAWLPTHSQRHHCETTVEGKLQYLTLADLI
jgi:hypothetical protein